MNQSAANILVVDDDQRLRDLLDRYLGEQGFGVHAVASAPAMDKVMGKEDVDMIILDLMLPGEDGMSVCRRLRAAGRRIPIIMLTAKGDETDRIAGLDVGADDYLPKPFNPRELVARINAVLRRQSPVATSPGAPDDSRKPVKFGPFEINLATRLLTRNGKQVGLTTGEFAMLKTLVRSRIHACRCRATGSWNSPAAASTVYSIAASTCRFRDCAGCWRKTLRTRATSRRCGAWAMYSYLTTTSNSGRKHELGSAVAAVAFGPADFGAAGAEPADLVRAL